MIVVPGKLDGVLAHALGGERLGMGLEHPQRAGQSAHRFARLPSCLTALVFAHGAGAGIAQVDEVVVRDVAVVPFDVHPGAGGEIYFHRFGISGRSGGLERGLHGISIAQGRCAEAL